MWWTCPVVDAKGICELICADCCKCICRSKSGQKTFKDIHHTNMLWFKKRPVRHATAKEEASEWPAAILYFPSLSTAARSGQDCLAREEFPRPERFPFSQSCASSSDLNENRATGAASGQGPSGSLTSQETFCAYWRRMLAGSIGSSGSAGMTRACMISGAHARGVHFAASFGLFALAPCR